jgi:23S rRNA pseudouridine1911/1915/1917 synthase
VVKERIEIIAEEDDVRIDLYLSQQLNHLSRNYIQKLISEEAVTLNHVTLTSKKAKVAAGDLIVINLKEPERLNIKAESIPLEIVYEDDDLIVVNKPQGMVVHPAPGHYTGTLVNALMYNVERLSNINGTIRPGIVHRIDKDTSGLLMVAKNNVAHAFLAEQLKEKTAQREYYAIVNGVVKEEEGTVDAPLGRHPTDRKRIAIVSDGRRAVTHFKVLERFRYHTLLKLKLETGRTHQIRVHMASLGHPILGDPVYGVKQEKIKHDGQALHAKTLGFLHPTSGEWLSFDSELPEYFEILLRKCRGI